MPPALQPTARCFIDIRSQIHPTPEHQVHSETADLYYS
jgi:hypothetical protein